MIDSTQIYRDLKLEPAAGADALIGTENLALADSMEMAVEGADSVLILTEWRVYLDLNWPDLASLMHRPALVFDG